MTNEPSNFPHHIAILLFGGVEELDAVGPWEVLAHWTRNHPDDGWAVSCMSQDGLPVTASKGLVLGAHHAIAAHHPCRYSSTQAAKAPGVFFATPNTSTGSATNARPSR